jgi:hypothetical protein
MANKNTRKRKGGKKRKPKKLSILRKIVEVRKEVDSDSGRTRKQHRKKPELTLKEKLTELRSRTITLADGKFLI